MELKWVGEFLAISSGADVDVVEGIGCTGIVLEQRDDDENNKQW